MNPFLLVAQAQAEATRLEQVSKAVLAARPLNVVALWEAQRAAERAQQRARQVQRRLDTWKRLRWQRLGPRLSAVEAGRRRLSWQALKKALGTLEERQAGLEAWLLALERLSRASRQAGDRWSFYTVAAIRQALTQPDDLQAELLRQPVEHLVRLVRTLSPWAVSLEQAERALTWWAEERRLERAAGHVPRLAA
jgi:hypothetical protein